MTIKNKKDSRFISLNDAFNAPKVGTRTSESGEILSNFPAPVLEHDES
jgi:hypothetical protein